MNYICTERLLNNQITFWLGLESDAFIASQHLDTPVLLFCFQKAALQHFIICFIPVDVQLVTREIWIFPCCCLNITRQVNRCKNQIRLAALTFSFPLFVYSVHPNCGARPSVLDLLTLTLQPPASPSFPSLSPHLHSYVWPVSCAGPRSISPTMKSSITQCVVLSTWSLCMVLLMLCCEWVQSWSCGSASSHWCNT